MSKDVFIVAEQRDGAIQKVAFELLGKAKELAETLEQKVVAVLLGDQIRGRAQTLIEHGADEVIVVDHALLKDYNTEPYAKALTAVVREREPEILLFGATSIGRDLAPRVSARVHTGLTADCTGLEIDVTSKNLFMTRPAFGGNIMATIQCANHRPQMATVRPGVMKALPKNAESTGVISQVAVELESKDEAVKIVEVVKATKKSADIIEAKCLVSGGRGIGKPEKFEMLRQLADLLGGEVSSSRANVDAGWINRDKQVGQTGKTVRPQLYVACGISGAVQHLVGMENADYIIAINKDSSAPVFDVADLGIVGDVNVIVPKLIDAITKRKAEKEIQ
ncbi:MAG: electron transfer flavoprotein subunit alpha/FixB family protein [Oscillospiraceae bacterium]|nr:electron transfer flavoprotein subunit alpha/FixB family protein [Oscillospiraceae bacterium]